MRPDMNLDPNGLRSVAAAVVSLVDDLSPLLARRSDMAPEELHDGRVLVAEQIRLRTTAERVSAELTAMHAALRAVAAAAEHADLDVARDLRRSAGGEW
ncbi:MAG: hypothetical protein ACT4RN_02235 [Pseudonocardia sp.]